MGLANTDVDRWIALAFYRGSSVNWPQHSRHAYRRSATLAAFLRLLPGGWSFRRDSNTRLESLSTCYRFENKKRISGFVTNSRWFDCFGNARDRLQTQFQVQNNIDSLFRMITEIGQKAILVVDLGPFFGNTVSTTHPSQGHSIGFCLGRKNRLLGGFFISSCLLLLYVLLGHFFNFFSLRSSLGAVGGSAH